MKNFIYILALIPLFFSSCIKSGLDELPVYGEAEITDFDLEHRFITQNSNGFDVLMGIELLSEITIDEANSSITVTATVPEATSSFSDEERNKVSLDNIVGYTLISPAATIKPVASSPVLGVPGDFSNVVSYMVMAADGKSTKTWTVTIAPLNF